MKRLIQSIKVDLGLLRERLYNWLEYQEAKEWAKFYHPGWLQIAKKAPGRITQQVYREKILRAYRGEWDG
jgi:hypothetical protein